EEIGMETPTETLDEEIWPTAWEEAQIITEPGDHLAAPTTSASFFNPQISVVLDGQVTAYAHIPNELQLPGFLIGEETRLFPQGASINGSEINLQGIVDDWLFASVTIHIESHDNRIEFEL
ncbi:MAG: hypothetical protein V3V61_04060, partial [Gammaproteobacteria bacterium]